MSRTTNVTRRVVLSSAALLPTLPLLANGKEGVGEESKKNSVAVESSTLTGTVTSVAVSNTAKPLVHVADLFRPHNDADDHWDLATAYALAHSGDLDLLGLLVDNPENIKERPDLQRVFDDFVDGHRHVARGPDAAAVAQLNYIVDRAVPVAVGTVWPSKPDEKIREDNLPEDLRGVNMLLDLLRRSPRPVTILIGGSSQDVAIAGKKEPRLFTEKCAGIYLVAGVGSQDAKGQVSEGEVEWNVNLNRGAYATIFELPCPVFWMPCFSVIPSDDATVGEWGAFWSFRQRELLPDLSDNLKAFFAYVLSKESGTNWLSYLLDSHSKTVAMKFLDEDRAMYCTAGFLHAAGKAVTSEGQIVPLQAAGENSVYEFIPITVRCSDSGITEWQKSAVATDRYIFRVKEENKYAGAMLKALRSILVNLA